MTEKTTTFFWRGHGHGPRCAHASSGRQVVMTQLLAMIRVLAAQSLHADHIKILTTDVVDVYSIGFV